jgi:signal transduction histidine kinase
MKSEFKLTHINRDLKIKGNFNRLTQLMARLLANAEKFSSDESPVKISVTREENIGLVSVPTTALQFHIPLRNKSFRDSHKSIHPISAKPVTLL